ncbi:hypothetical protein [Agrobacterium rosae]|uniref:hypothetical protein n=1 Tax=Agrobacterium rosae TaxID=1972867 RepID=UPI003BA14BF8
MRLRLRGPRKPPVEDLGRQHVDRDERDNHLGTFALHPGHGVLAFLAANGCSGVLGDECLSTGHTLAHDLSLCLVGIRARS